MSGVAPRPSFDHLLALSDAFGTFEHADHAQIRPEHGYCTDDAARVLVVAVREPEPNQAIRELGETALRFLVDAQGVDGTVRNRRSVGGRWHGPRTVEDCWGRSIWAFGAAARTAPQPWMREVARSCFDRGIEQRSPWRRSMAFAALGAADVVAVDPRHRGARALLADTIVVIGAIGTDPDWPWPEARLTYANAVVAEALLAAGSVLDRPDVVADGLTLLAWLLDRETIDGHLSPTPAGGSGPEAAGPAFDQQPIEIAAMADACRRAAAITGERRWLDAIDLAAAWFTGDNDAAAVMWDTSTNGGYDGLHATGPNRNQGAESTIALISTMQQARDLAPARG